MAEVTSLTTKTYEESDAAIKAYVNRILDLWRTQDTASFDKVLSNFHPQVVFDTPLLHIRGRAPLRVMMPVIKSVLWRRVGAEPLLVTVGLSPDKKLVKIIVDAKLLAEPRLSFWPLDYVIPQTVIFYVNIDTIISAMDDSVLEIRARLHNYPELPLFLRKLLGFGLSTMAPLAAGVLKYTPWYNEGTPEPETRYRSE